MVRSSPKRSNEPSGASSQSSRTWQKGVLTGDDYWARADQLIAKRISGVIDRESTSLQLFTRDNDVFDVLGRVLFLNEVEEDAEYNVPGRTFFVNQFVPEVSEQNETIPG